MLRYPPKRQAPGDQLAVPAGQSVASKNNIASPHEVSAKILGNVLAGSGPSCILSENALRADGGSFSVLAHRPDGVVLSWAGLATAATSPAPPAHRCWSPPPPINPSTSGAPPPLMSVEPAA